MANEPLEGRVVLLTGGTGGLGREAALALADRGASVAIVGRNRKRGRETATEIGSRPGEYAGFYVADLASQRSVRRLAEAVRSRHDRLDVLVNNAGTFRARREETVDGIESTLAVNHLAPYLLTHRLADLLAEGAPARVVTVASGLHERGRIRFEDLEFEGDYDGRAAYAQSKLANVHFAHELAIRLEGTGVTSNAIDPGFVPATSLAREASTRSRTALAAMTRLPLPFTRSIEEGAESIVRAVAEPGLDGMTGAYLRDGDPTPTAASDDETARRLWDVSAGLVGVSPDAPPLDR